MRLEDLSLTHSVSQSVSDKDGHHVYLYVFISMFFALSLHQLCTSSCTPNLCSTRIFYFFLFVSYPCRRSRTQVPSRTTTSFASRTSLDSVESPENESTLIWMWKVIFSCFFLFLKIYSDSYPNHFPPLPFNSSSSEISGSCRRFLWISSASS